VRSLSKQKEKRAVPVRNRPLKQSLLSSKLAGQTLNS
jgi:hypothetical protein